MGITVRAIGPDDFDAWRRQVAALRIEVFRAWPYLYDGDLEYEARYLETYMRSPDAVWVLAEEGRRVIGASTGLPLEDEEPGFFAPFVEAGWDPTRVFYFGESVLLSAWRGQGIGHRFFDAREAHARSLGRYSHAAFAAVDRDPDDPRRPAGYRDLAPFWERRGYRRHPELQTRIAWKELGEAAESEKHLTFWLRRL